MATSRIGTKETMRTAGAFTPTPWVTTMKPGGAAGEDAGAVEATPMTRFDMNPSALALRPLSPVWMWPSSSLGASTSVVIGCSFRSKLSLHLLPRLGEDVAEDPGHLVELGLRRHERRRDLHHRVAAVVGP